MAIAFEQLAQQLQKHLLPVYFLHGDEPLLMQETQGLIREAARQQGYESHEIHSVDRSFSWDAFAAECQSLSLFAERKVVQLRLANKPDAHAIEFLTEIAKRPPEDSVLIVSMPKLDNRALKGKLGDLLQLGGAVSVPTIDADRLPMWLQRRAQQLHITITADALQLLCDRTEGNLLAASQTLNQLQLLYPDTEIGARELADVVSHSARYSVFDLVDAMLNGEAERTARLVLGLASEGTPESVVLWAVQKDVRALNRVAEQLHCQGQQQPSSAQLEAVGFWSSRQPQARAALKRLSFARLQLVSLRLVDIDRAIKGQAAENAWDEILRLCMIIAGKPLFIGKGRD